MLEKWEICICIVQIPNRHLNKIKRKENREVINMIYNKKDKEKKIKCHLSICTV